MRDHRQTASRANWHGSVAFTQSGQRHLPDTANAFAGCVNHDIAHSVRAMGIFLCHDLPWVSRDSIARSVRAMGIFLCLAPSFIYCIWLHCPGRTHPPTWIDFFYPRSKQGPRSQRGAFFGLVTLPRLTRQMPHITVFPCRYRMKIAWRLSWLSSLRTVVRGCLSSWRSMGWMSLRCIGCA